MTIKIRKLNAYFFECTQAMTEEIETTFPQGHFSWDDRKPTDVASILKHFLR